MKKEQGLRKTRFWVRESVTRGEDISTTTTSVLRLLPLIKCATVMWFFKIFIFPKK